MISMNRRKIGLLLADLIIVLSLLCAAASPSNAQTPPSTNPQPEMVLQTVRSAQVTTVAFSPDGRTIASGEQDGTIKLRDAATGDLKRILPGHGEDVRCVAFSPDGKLIAGADRVNQVKLWNAVTGELKRTLPVDARDGVGPDFASSVVFSPDGTILAVSGEQVWLWEARTGKLKHTLSGDAQQLIFTPDGNTLFGLKYGSETKRWDVTTGKAQSPLKVGGNAKANLAFSPDGSAFAIQELNGTINLYDTRTSKFQRKFSVTDVEILDFRCYPAFTFSADGQAILTLDANQVLRSWNVQTGAMKEISLSKKESKEAVHAIRFSPDAKFFVTISGAPVIRFRLSETATGQAKWVSPQWPTLESSLKDSFEDLLKKSAQGIYESTRISPDASLVAIYKGDGVVKCLDARTGKLKFTMAREGERLIGAGFEQDGKLIVTSSDNGKWRFWDAGTGDLKGTLNKVFEKMPEGRDEKAAQLLAPLFFISSSDGRIAASFNEDVIKFWDTQQGEVKFTFKTKLRPFSGNSNEAGFTFSPDNRTLAVWNKFPLLGDPKTVPDAEKLRVVLVDADTGKIKHTLVTDAEWIHALAFSPASHLLAIVEKGGFNLWEVETGKLKYRITWHVQPISPSSEAIAFAPDGRTVVFVAEEGIDGGDPKILLCDVATGQIKHRLPVPENDIHAIAFSPDSKSLAASTFKDLRLWDAQTGARTRTITNDAGTFTQVIFTPDSRRLMVSTNDRVKVHDAMSGRLLATLETLPATRLNELNSGWIAYTPEGYYIGSENAARFLRWRVGDKLLPAESYAKEFNRPDLVMKAIRDGR